MRQKTGAAVSLVLAAAMALQTTVLAAPPFDNLPEGLTAERNAELCDDTINWEELADIAQYRNPTYTKIYDNAMEAVTDSQAAYGEFAIYVRDTVNNLDTAIEQMTAQQEQLQKLPSSATVELGGATLSRDEALAALKRQQQEARAGRSQTVRSVIQVNTQLSQAPDKVNRQLYPYKKQITYALQSLVLGYQQLATNQRMLEKQVSVYEAAYSAQQELYTQGMATAASVQLAKNNLDTARQSLESLKLSGEQLLHSLGLQAGYGTDVLPKVGALPEPDLQYAETTDAEADKEKALSGNSDVISAGRASDGSSYAFLLRDMTENEAKGRLSAKMDELYADMQEKAALYKTAQTTLERARLAKESAELKAQLGMLGRAELEGQQLAYISYEASAELARLNLLQSITVYRWAVDGLVTL